MLRPRLIILKKNVNENVVRGYDVITTLQLTLFCSEKSSVRKMMCYCFSGVFSAFLVEIR